MFGMKKAKQEAAANAAAVASGGTGKQTAAQLRVAKGAWCALALRRIVRGPRAHCAPFC